MLKKILTLMVVVVSVSAVLLLGTRNLAYEVTASQILPESREQVWQMLTAVDAWPQWWPGMEAARLPGEWLPGATVEISYAGEPPLTSYTVETVVPLRNLVWARSQFFGSVSRMGFELFPDIEGTRVEFVRSELGFSALIGRLRGEDAFTPHPRDVLAGLAEYLASPVSDADRGV